MTHNQRNTLADLIQIHRAISMLCEVDRVYELRILNTRRGTIRGYFNDFEQLTQAAARMSGKAPAVFLTANPTKPELLARGANRLVEYARETTADTDIVKRNWFLVDFDAVRPAGISSTDDEHQKAISRAQECRERLILRGWPEPITADSGNGAHLLWKVSLPNDSNATNLLMNCLKALSFQFDDETVKVDTGNFNAARIWKLYGTLVAKGDSILERPHRLARVLEAPEPIQSVPMSFLESLAAQVPQHPPAAARRPYRSTGEDFDLKKWITDFDISVRHQGTWNDGDKWVLSRCLWNADHTDKSAFIVRFPNGAIAAGCHHNSCQGKGWPELREAVEPGYKEKRKSPKYTGNTKGHQKVYLPTVEVPI